MNIVHKIENHMFNKFASLFTALMFSATTGLAGPSTQHSAQAAAHSGAAASHSAAAVASGAAVVVAVPILAVGSTLSLSGAALQSAGSGAVQLGSQIIKDTQPPLDALPNPDPAPSLDGATGGRP